MTLSLSPPLIPLELIVIRHGIAEDPVAGQEDAARALTDKGRQKTLNIARALVAKGWHCERLLTSPLRRAHQTAEIFLEQGLAATLETFEPLAPGGNFSDLIAWWESQPPVQAVAIVGHQPDLSRWVVTALWGSGGSDPESKLPFKKAGMAHVEFPDGVVAAGRGNLLSLVTPRLLLP